MLSLDLVDFVMEEEAAAAEVAGLGLGLLDIAVIGGVAALAIYWFVLRKKKDDIPEVKKLTIA